MREDTQIRGIRVFQHVDDLAQVMWAKEEGDLANRSYNSVRMWAKDVRMALHMQSSGKNVIIPEGMPASIGQRALLEEGVKVSVENHGVDVGTDVAAGKKKAAKKLRERERTREQRKPGE